MAQKDTFIFYRNGGLGPPSTNTWPSVDDHIPMCNPLSRRGSRALRHGSQKCSPAKSSSKSRGGNHGQKKELLRIRSVQDQETSQIKVCEEMIWLEKRSAEAGQPIRNDQNLKVVLTRPPKLSKVSLLVFCN